MKGKIVRKRSTKRKLRANIMKMLNDLKESENDEFKAYGEKRTGLIKAIFGNSLMQKH
jgi:hypothetical protein